MISRLTLAELCLHVLRLERRAIETMADDDLYFLGTAKEQLESAALEIVAHSPDPFSDALGIFADQPN